MIIESFCASVNFVRTSNWDYQEAARNIYKYNIYNLDNNLQNHKGHAGKSRTYPGNL